MGTVFPKTVFERGEGRRKKGWEGRREGKRRKGKREEEYQG